jgi:hypothetical protein
LLGSVSAASLGPEAGSRSLVVPNRPLPLTSRCGNESLPQAASGAHPSPDAEAPSRPRPHGLTSSPRRSSPRNPLAEATTDALSDSPKRAISRSCAPASPSSRRTGRLADTNAHRSVFALVKPSNDADGGRLPWGFGPFGACGFGQRLIPGLPPPATRRPRVFSTPRRIAPPVTCPALFHAGNAPGLPLSEVFPPW